MANVPDDYMLSGLYPRRNMMALPKHTGPGALTRKECGYTAPSHEELMKEIKYITKEMGGTLEVFDCYDSYNNWKKIEIIYDQKEK